MITIGDRRVKVQTGTHSQTVNICTEANTHGEYAYILRLRPPFTSEGELAAQGLASAEDLVAYLLQHYHAALEKSPLGALQGTPPSTANVMRPLSEWERQAISLVEAAIDDLVRDFLQYPYLHRVEHSLHCELYNLLKQHPLFSATYPLGRTTTQCLHKEWPEWHTRPDKGNRRGSYDLAVLSPETLSQASLDDFINGRLEPLLVVEFGLDYLYRHFASDDAKLTNSEVQHGYLIHLVRESLVDDFDAVEQLALASRHKVAYARVGYEQVAYKYLNATQITFARR